MGYFVNRRHVEPFEYWANVGEYDAMDSPRVNGRRRLTSFVPNRLQTLTRLELAVFCVESIAYATID